MDQRNDTEALIEFLKTHRVSLISTNHIRYPLMVVPNGTTLKSLEEFLPKPDRIRETVKVGSVEAFLDYWGIYGDADNSIIFCGPLDEPYLEGIIDYHVHDGDGAVSASWCTWRVRFDFPITLEFKAWQDNAGNWFGQEGWLEFLQDRSPELIEPEAAKMLNLAHHFEGKKTVNFTSAKRLESGDLQINYQEQTQASGGERTEKVPVPETIRFCVRPYEGSELAVFDASFRYRVKEGRILFGYRLIRPEDILRPAYKEVIERVKGEAGNKPVLLA